MTICPSFNGCTTVMFVTSSQGFSVYFFFIKHYLSEKTNPSVTIKSTYRLPWLCVTSDTAKYPWLNTVCLMDTMQYVCCLTWILLHFGHSDRWCPGTISGFRTSATIKQTEVVRFILGESQRKLHVLDSGSQCAGIIMRMRPANERRRYNVTSSLIGWAHTQNDPWCVPTNTVDMDGSSDHVNLSLRADISTHVEWTSIPRVLPLLCGLDYRGSLSLFKSPNMYKNRLMYNNILI